MGIQTPIRIEAFDNSNIQGVDIFNGNICGCRIKDIVNDWKGPDDYKSMREVVRRRAYLMKVFHYQILLSLMVVKDICLAS